MVFRRIYNWLMSDRGPAKGESTASAAISSAAFLVPTIAQELPPLDPPSMPSGPMSLLLNEHSWRQIELLPRAKQTEADEGLAAIRAHISRATLEVGFQSVHVRPMAPPPLHLPLADLESALQSRTRGSLFLSTDDGMCRVPAGAVANLEGSGLLYWLEREGEAQVLGLSILGGDPANGDLAPVVALAKQFDLILVDWIGVERIDPASEDSLRAWVRRYVQRDNAWID